jgi:adenine-specific DNA-methyltransferase
VVAYTLKALGYAVTASDFLSFPTVIAAATTANQGVQLSSADVDRIVGPNADGRDFIQRTFNGLYFTADDRAFLDSAWSHITQLADEKRALAIAALTLAAARKQPRGVFTFTDLRYDDGRRDLRLSLREHFTKAVEAYNAVVFDSGMECRAKHSDVFELDPAGYDLVYLDPPYAPPRCPPRSTKLSKLCRNRASPLSVST